MSLITFLAWNLFCLTQACICCCWLVTKFSLTLLWPMDYSPPGSSVHGTFQVRTLERHFLLKGVFPTQVWTQIFCIGYTLYFSCHLLGVSSSIPSLWACLSLELRWVSCSQHIVRSWFLNHPDTLCLLISESNSFKFKVIIDKWRWVSLFYLLFSGCSISPLLLFPCVSVYHFSWRVSMMFFSVSSFSVSCLCSRFTFCDYYEVWKNVS